MKTLPLLPESNFTSTESDWLELWTSVIKNHPVGRGCSVEMVNTPTFDGWTMKVVSIKHPSDSNNYAIQITPIGTINENCFSVDLVNLDEEFDDYNYYQEGLEWENTTIGTLASISYLYELLPTLMY